MIFFNRELFGNERTECAEQVLNITLRVTAAATAITPWSRFADRATRRIDEMRSMRSASMSTIPASILSTLVHEMKYLFRQQHFGCPQPPPLSQWRMGRRDGSPAGLMPSNQRHRLVGAPIEQMSDYIIDGGPYDELDETDGRRLRLAVADIHRPTDRKKAEFEIEVGMPAMQADCSRSTTEVDCWRCGLPLVCLALQS